MIQTKIFPRLFKSNNIFCLLHNTYDRMIPFMIGTYFARIRFGNILTYGTIMNFLLCILNGINYIFCFFFRKRKYMLRHTNCAFMANSGHFLENLDEFGKRCGVKHCQLLLIQVSLNINVNIISQTTHKCKHFYNIICRISHLMINFLFFCFKKLEVQLEVIFLACRICAFCAICRWKIIYFY